MESTHSLKLVKLFQWKMFLLLMICLGTPAFASADPKDQVIQQITTNGYMNWTTGFATAKGLGIPPSHSVNAFQAKEMTRSAAWSVALANLLEVINGIRVDAHTTVQNHMTTNSEVQTRVEGLVRGATVVEERELPSGGGIEITVQSNLAGTIPEAINKNRPRKPNPPPSPPPSPSIYTGLVIDARNTRATPALQPQIMTSDNIEIYGPATVNHEFLSGPSLTEPGRIAWYVNNESEMRSHYKAGTNPIVIKALRATGDNNVNLVIGRTKGELIQALPEYQEFLGKAKVLILLDHK